MNWTELWGEKKVLEKLCFSIKKKDIIKNRLIKAGVHVKAVLCKFLGDFWAFWERDIFSQRIG